MDLQEVYSAWAADTPAAVTSGGGPLKQLLGGGGGGGGGAEAGGGGPASAAAAVSHLGGGAAGGPRTSSGFMLTADCSVGGALAPRAPPPAAAAEAAAAAAAAAPNNFSNNNNNGAPFCFLPGTAGAGVDGNTNAGARSPESEATRLPAVGNHHGDFQQHLMLPAVAVRAPTTTSSPEASSVAAAVPNAAAAAAAAAAPQLLHPPPATTTTTTTASYDFATVYALLGSLFDPACAGIDHASALAQMPRGEREVAGVWLRSVAAHLACPAAMAGHAAALTEATLMDRTTSAAAPAGAGFPQLQQQQQ